MTVYRTEAEQLEAIKKWWQRYNNLITVLLSILLLSVAGYKYYNWHQEKVTLQASNAYEHLMVSFSNQDNRGVRSYANQLLNDYGTTVYADAARLTLAKLYVLREKYSKAEQALNYVAMNSKMMVFRQVANIRLARLLLAQKQYDKALTKLSSVEHSVYMPVVNELKGDIFAAKGEYQKAVVAYRKAINEVQMNGMGNLFLEMKTNELAAMTQSMKVDDKKLNSLS